MTKVLLSMLLFGFQQWLAVTDNTAENERVITAEVVVHSGDKAGKECCAGLSTEDCIALASAPGTAAHAAVFVSGGDGNGEGKVITKVIKLRKDEDGDEQNRGWLGVSIGAVPEVVASQLNLDGRGIIVLNVIPDSPAEQAGLKANDILLAIDGTDVEGMVSLGAKFIGSHKPGDEVELTVLRDGKEESLTAVLGSRADMPAFSWKFGVPPLAELDEEVKTRGGIVRLGPEGKWEFKDLGDIAALEGLPEHILKMIPNSGSSSIRVWADGNNKNVKCTREAADGTSISIEQEGEGKIVVTRKDDQGNETVATYASADELRDGDPEAFDFYEEAGKSVVVKVNIDGLADLTDIDVDLNLDDLKNNVARWTGSVGESVAEALKEYEVDIEALRERLSRIKELDGGGVAAFFGKPRQTFKVLADGTIEVRLRKGDSELVRTFDGEGDLQQRQPDLYEKYLDLTAEEE